MKPRVYLDNAATSWPKPEAVYAAMDDYSRHNGAAAARGTHKKALAAKRSLEQARQNLKSLIGASQEDCLVFCFNGTDALNLCIHGLLREGDHVITSAVEHNSVLRPLRALEQSKSIVLDVVDCDDDGRASVSQIQRCLGPSTRLVAITHASNVTGTIQPVEAIGQMVHEAGRLLLVDAAQTVGSYPVNMHALNADMIAFSGHKGLLGPLGTGVAALRAGLDRELVPLRQGGTGTQSEVDQQPTSGEAKFESGNPNLPGIVGLAAGVDYVLENSRAIQASKQRLTKALLAGLQEIPGLKIHGPKDIQQRVSVVSFNLAHIDCHELAILLESQAGIEARAGLHCAPRIHEALGTASRGGTVRVSLGPFNTSEHVDKLISAVAAVAEMFPS